LLLRMLPSPNSVATSSFSNSLSVPIRAMLLAIVLGVREYDSKQPTVINTSK
jgi:hypothetical protein